MMNERILGKRPQVLFSVEDIKKRIQELGEQIQADYQGEPIIVVGVMKGALVFMMDLIRSIQTPLSIDFIGAQSYEGTSSTGQVRMTHDLTTDIEGKHVIVVEDIIDTGRTMNYLLSTLQVRRPKSLKVCVLLSKPEAHEIDCPIDYCGFEISKEFVIGYGLDLDGRYRNLPHIAQLVD